MVAVEDLHRVLDELLRAERFAGSDDPHGVWLAGDRDVQAVGFALEPWPGLAEWATAQSLDALVLHRPWDAPLADLAGLTVFGYHLAFDEALTVGLNAWLAEAVGMRAVEPLGAKAGRPLGMIGDIDRVRAVEVARRFGDVFGAAGELRGNGERVVGRIGVVGAMWPDLVIEAARRGADLYVTGAWRDRAEAVVVETGIAVLVVGHDPPERWGMRTLGDLVTDRIPDLRVVLAPEY